MAQPRKQEVDAIDRRIIAELGRDARLSVRALAEKVHISRTSVHTRLTALLEHRVITGFSATVDRHALSLGVSAIVIVKVDADWPTVSAALAALPFVEKAQALSGDIDILLNVSAPTQEQLSDTILRRIHNTPGVASTSSYIVLEELAGTAPEQATDSWKL